MSSYHEIHREIIELSKAGNGKAQKELYLLYAKAMYNICYRMMNNREEAEDMLQESFAEAFTKLQSFRFESAFGAWLKRITVNKCINTLKKKRMQFTDERQFEEFAEDGNDEEIPGLSVESVQAAMAELPEGYRVIFSLYLLEGYDHGEIAQILGISEATSKSQFSRAKKKMRDIIKNNTHVGQF